MNIRRTLFTVVAAGICAVSLQARNWYVTGQGNDDNDGLTEKTAFRTLQRAADVVAPGDVVNIGDGDYTMEGRKDNEAVVNITRSGTPDAWITWRAIPGQNPVVRPAGCWSGIRILASYQIIDGISVIGMNDSIALKYAIADLKNPAPDPLYNTNGIFMEGRQCPADSKPHHVVIRNCTVAKCPGGGITMIEGDYFTVEDCIVYNNCWFMRYAGSGITTLNNWAYDNGPGYHVIIRRNLVWNNKCFVSWEKIGKLSDGNGILLDVTNKDGQNLTNPDADAIVSDKAAPVRKDERPVWRNRALIANNVSAYNGGSGIHTFRTSHVDIINNTTYWNGTNVDYEEIFPNNSVDVTIMNNIMVPRPGGRVTSDNRNTGIVWDYNLYPVEQDVLRGEHDIVADPMFICPDIDLSRADFRLRKGSPAIDSGTSDKAQPDDVTGARRPKGSGPDRGAYER